MATYHTIPRPPRPRGPEEERWNQIFTFLYQLAEAVEQAVNSRQSTEEVKKDGK